MIKYSDHGITDQCPLHGSKTIDECRKCGFFLGSSGFDVKCGYKSSPITKLTGRLRSAVKVKLGTALIWSAPFILMFGVGLFCPLVLWFKIMMVFVGTATLFVGDSMVWEGIEDIKKEQKGTKNPIIEQF